jgi:hypothetical protein
MPEKEMEERKNADTNSDPTESTHAHCLGCSIEHELKTHAPFTLLGTLTGALILAAMLVLKLPEPASHTLFAIFHPTHVFFSAMTTAAVYYLHNKKCGMIKLLLVGYFGSIGIATLSDCVIPFIGEVMLKLPHPELHLGFIHLWFLVNPLAIAGVFAARLFTVTKFPHFMHVQISTWASLFHITMAMGATISPMTFLLVVLFLFVAVWVPCCTSDIIFPLLFTTKQQLKNETHTHH